MHYHTAMHERIRGVERGPAQSKKGNRDEF